MSTTVKPTTGTPPFTTDELTVIVASLSCLLFLLVIMVVLCLLYRRDPICCKVREYHESHTDLATNPQYYSSTQTLVGPACSQHMSHENTHRQSDSLFLIGLPSSYGLPSLAVPRLPSYESVRKKDRQRQIHMLIADRFGLNGPYISEPPPSYEESVRHSVEIPCGVIGPLHDPSDVIGPSEVSCDAIGPFQAPGDVIGPSEVSCDVIGPSEVSCDAIGPFQAPGDVIGPSEVSCDVIGPSEVSCDAIGPFQAPGDVIGPLAMAGSSSPPCDMTGALDTCCDIISPLPAPCDMIGRVNAPPHGIGPVSELPETHP
ncbi:uncharacterized protein si:ch73-364h19.1 isoform X2 [Alosa sapidissima]|uniref:uncharacterized protein si:ch73-364h19.1 isoform X2 n=1 Tax=Alosa sapidissima TaxID=34773 RepID=UPI001C09F52D|nr:uncharacterized protein si:ch73-364h19.1 isoform X2 [Alosa sapidissima]